MRRGLASATLGVVACFASSMLGSGALRLLGAGLLALPVISWCWVHIAPARVTLERRLSSTMLPAGSTLEVTVDVTSTRAASAIIVRESVPPSMGQPVAICLEGVPSNAGRRAMYTLTPPHRGRFLIGPATVDITDPFGLARTTSTMDASDTIIVTPAVEPLVGFPAEGSRASSGASATRRSRGTSEEFATIRPYVEGDDLRRVHWPSVARQGELVIRQDEARRSAGVTVFLETRMAALGKSGDPGFERAVSAAASLGIHLRQSSSLRLVTSDHASVIVSPREFLVTLASVEDSATPRLGMERIATGGSDPVFAAIMAPPSTDEVIALIRNTSGATTRIACLVFPPRDTPAGARAAERGIGVSAALRAASFTVIELDPFTSLAQRWNNRAHATSA